MFELGILSNGKQSGFSVTRKQNPKAKDRYVEEPAFARYIRIKERQNKQSTDKK